MTQVTVVLTDANNNRWNVDATVLTDGNIAFNSVLNGSGGNLAAVDVSGNLATQKGGSKSALNQTTAAAIKASPGRLRKVIVIAPGSTGGAFTFNDCVSTMAAAAANEVWSIAYNAAANVGGAVFELDIPMLSGIVLSAVPTGGSPVVAVFYD